MQPTLVSGDYVFATNLLKNSFKKNNLIVFFDKTHSYIIKRISLINNNQFILKSDNKETESLFCQSPINKNKLLFVVLFVLKKKYIDLILKTKNKFLFFI